jgi:hypothetical protein
LFKKSRKGGRKTDFFLKKKVSEFEKLKDDLQTTVHDQETILKEAFQKVTDLETTINVIPLKSF